MFLCLCGLLLAGFPVAFTLSGTALGFALIGSLLGAFDLGFLVAFPQRIFQTMANETLVAVPLFVFTGVMLERSKIAEELLDSMGRLFGPLPGGLAIGVCIVGALLAATTGIVGATVVTMGLLSLPTMLRRGYDRRLACGTIAASGTLGQIIPPSIILVILGDQLSIAYQNAQFAQGVFAPETVTVNDLFAGALIPGLVLVGLYIVFIIALTGLRPHLAPAMPRAERAAGVWREATRSLVAPLFLIMAVLGSILAGLATPTEAASVGAVGAVMLAAYRPSGSQGDGSRSGEPSDPGARLVLLGAACLMGLLALAWTFDLRAQRRTVSSGEWTAIGAAFLLALGLAAGVAAAFARVFRARTPEGERVLAAVARSTMSLSAVMFTIVIGASLFALVFRGFGGDRAIEEILRALPGGTAGAVALVMLAMFVMAFFVDFIEIMFIVVPVTAPALLQMTMPDGSPMSPVWLGVLMAMNLQTSFLHPPLGFALFYLRSVAPPEVSTGDIYRGAIPFVALQLVMLAILWFAPGLAVWLPAALYGG